MGRGIVKNMLAVVVALVLTVGVVFVLSAASKAAPDPAAEYSRQVRREEVQVEELSAPVHTHEPVSFLEAAGGFLLILGVSAVGALFLLRAMQKNRTVHNAQSYQPRRDMAHIASRPVRRM